MDKVKLGTGVEFDTDYLSSIPNPKMLFFRVLNSDFVTVAAAVSNAENMADIEYEGNHFTGCTLVALSMENSAIKVNANYDTFVPKPEPVVEENGEVSEDG